MTPFAFDTLSASKRLREAGMAEGVAEAVVSVFQHAAEMPDIRHLATKDDLEAATTATRADVEALRLATKADFEALRLATKADLEGAVTSLRTEMATKAELHALEVRLMNRMQAQTWAMIGVMSGVIGLSTAVIKLFP